MAMPTDLATEVIALQIPSQPVKWHGNLIVLTTVQIHLKMDQLPSSVGSSSPGCKTSSASHACWSLDLKIALVLVALAGILILALLYRVLFLRHKLRMAQAGNALEYFGFYHMAHYSLKDSNLTPAVTTVVTQTPTPSEVSSPHPSIVLSPPLSIPQLPPLPLPLPPSPPSPPPHSLQPPPHPIIYTTPPSPHSDAEVYSRIGALRPSRLSSLSQTQVVLFEHSTL